MLFYTCSEVFEQVENKDLNGLAQADFSAQGAIFVQAEDQDLLTTWRR